ncbi:MAG: ubiquitin-like domain-containing protein [Candidatus Saccharimonas sp.]
MNTSILRRHHHQIIIAAICAVIVLLVGVVFSFRQAYAADTEKPAANEHIITLHDDGVEKGFITKKHTLREALAEAKIRLDERDRTEPGIDEKLVAGSYQVNIYRARPVLVRDNGSETKVITSYRTPKQIAKEAKLTLQDEDMATLAPSNDPIADGAAEIMNIDRAVGFSFDFYGKVTQSYTQASTVGEMLKEKGIVMKSVDGISVSLDTKITPDVQVRLWRNGVQTVTSDEDVDFTVKKIQDVDQPVGYKQTQTEGEKGRRTVTYEINMQNGVEVSRKEINSVVTKQPIEQVEIIGAKVDGPEAIIAKIRAVAAAKGIADIQRILMIAKCESKFNPLADSGYYKGIFQHDPKYWPARAAKYGFAGASYFDVDAQIGVSLSMMATGGWSHWGCDPGPQI